MKNKEELVQILLEKAPQKKISCAEARALAEAEDLKYQEIGAICDELGIKVMQCELGCF